MSEAPQPPPPPPPTPPPASGPGKSKSGGVDDNIAGALAYLPIIAIIWLLVDPYNKNRFVRFHAFQALGLTVVSILASWIPLLGWCIIPLVVFVAAIVCAVKAFQNEKFKLPVLGNFAEEQANKA